MVEKRGGRMRKAYIAVMTLGLAALAVFTLAGKELYNIGKPTVATAAAKSLFLNGTDKYIAVPQRAVDTDAQGAFIYVVRSESGFSRTILTVEKREIFIAEMEKTEYELDDGFIWIAEGLAGNELIVTGSDKALTSGMRVIMP